MAMTNNIALNSPLPALTMPGRIHQTPAGTEHGAAGQEQTFGHFGHRTFKRLLCADDVPVALSIISGARATDASLTPLHHRR